MTTADATHDQHTHTGSEVPSYDDINTPVIVLVGIISAIVTLLTIMFVQGMYYHWSNSFLKDKTSEVVSIPASQTVLDQKALLKGGDGVFSIEEAMQAVVSKYGQ
jgi:hypothetical protein